MNEFPPVWPDPEGEERGESFSLLYKSAPVAAKNDPALYQLLALADVIRGGPGRERLLDNNPLGDWHANLYVLVCAEF